MRTCGVDADARMIVDMDKAQVGFIEAKEMTIESVFSTKAGIVWGALNENGSSTIGDIVQSASLRREEVYGALG